jgi:hypothetical protein
MDQNKKLLISVRAMVYSRRILTDIIFIYFRTYAVCLFSRPFR